MATLIFIEGENGYQCSECGAIYDREEVRRAFDYGAQIEENFSADCHCMDCATRWDAVKLPPEGLTRDEK